MFIRHRHGLVCLTTIPGTPWRLERRQHAKCLHFVTFSCHYREPLLGIAEARDRFEHTLEQVRCWYGFYASGYVVMPEHVHLLISERERGSLSLAVQMLKQNVARELRLAEGSPFWLPRYYDFNVSSDATRVEKLRYIHRNPVRRGLVENPEDWKWSSFLHYATGAEGVVEIESQWTLRKRERMSAGTVVESQNPRPVSPKTSTQGRGTLTINTSVQGAPSCPRSLREGGDVDFLSS
jgi:putative transposase